MPKHGRLCFFFSSSFLFFCLYFVFRFSFAVFLSVAYTSLSFFLSFLLFSLLILSEAALIKRRRTYETEFGDSLPNWTMKKYKLYEKPLKEHVSLWQFDQISLGGRTNWITYFCVFGWNCRRFLVKRPAFVHTQNRYIRLIISPWGICESEVHIQTPYESQTSYFHIWL